MRKTIKKRARKAVKVESDSLLKKKLEALPWVAKAEKVLPNSDLFKLSGWEITTRPNSLSVRVRHEIKKLRLGRFVSGPELKKPKEAFMLPMKLEMVRANSTYQARISLVEPHAKHAQVVPQNTVLASNSYYQDKNGIWFCVGNSVRDFKRARTMYNRVIMLAEFLQTAEHYDDGRGFAVYAGQNRLLPVSRK